MLLCCDVDVAHFRCGHNIDIMARPNPKGFNEHWLGCVCVCVLRYILLDLVGGVLLVLARIIRMDEDTRWTRRERQQIKMNSRGERTSDVHTHNHIDDDHHHHRLSCCSKLACSCRREGERTKERTSNIMSWWGNMHKHKHKHLRHLAAVLVAQMLANVHAEGAGAQAKAEPLRTKLATIALLAIELIIVAIVVGRVETLAAQLCDDAKDRMCEHR